MKRTILLSIIVLLIQTPFMSNAQTWQERKADMLYDNLLYGKAVIIYESLYRKYPQDNKYVERIAYCYDKMLNYRKALQYYALLVQLKEKRVSDYYEYAQLLRISGNFEEAGKWLEKYLEFQPDDQRARKQYDNLNELMQLKNNMNKIDVKIVDGNSKFIDMCPAYFEDRLVFSSSRDSFSMVKNEFKWNNEPFLKLYETKSYPEENLGRVKLLSSKLSSRMHEGPASFSSDFKTIYFTRNSDPGWTRTKSKNGINNLKIFVSSFDGKSWSEPKGFVHNSNDYSVGHPALTPDGKTLYFVSNMPGGYGETDIYKSELVNGQWSKPENLGPDINTKGKEMFPYVDKNGILYFSSDGHAGIAGLDIYASIENEKGKYTVTNLGEPLNSKYDDFGLAINTDSLKGYFTSNRPGGPGDDDIYSFAVSAVDLSVKSLRADNNQIFPESKIYLSTDSGEVITSAITGSDGIANFAVKPGAKYKLTAENGTYVADPAEITISGKILGLSQDEKVLLKQGYLYLTLEVIDKETGLIIPNSLIDISEGEYDQSSVEDNAGILKMKMKPNTNYTFYATGEEYFPRTVKYSSVDKKPGNYSLTIELENLSAGKQFTLEDLYYDYGKWNIRPDAALVLDKLAQLLLDNPSVRIEIDSHTDSRGSAESNLILSQRRSESVVDYLVRKGVDRSRLVPKGFGESQLINKCGDGVPCTEEEHAVNRRTVIEILNPEFKRVKRGNKNVYYF